MPHTCLTCEYFQAAPGPDDPPLPDANHGYCRAFPPTIQFIGAAPTQTGVTHWPCVHKDTTGCKAHFPLPTDHP